MKKNSFLSSLFAATLSLAATSVGASPLFTQADFSCPVVSQLSNFGDYIAGYGNEMVLSQNNPVYFQTIQWPAGVPDSLNGYYNSGTNYNSVNAHVTCSYASGDGSSQPFDLAYYVTNGKGGLVQWQNNESISLMLPVGLRK